MPRFISMSVAFVAVVALLSACGYVLSRWYAWDGVAAISGTALEGSLYVIAACCVYAGLVGVYHTILHVTGLDREKPAIFDDDDVSPVAGKQAPDVDVS